MTKPDEVKPEGWTKVVIDMLDPIMKALGPLADIFGAATPYVLYLVYCLIIVVILRVFAIL